MTRQSVRQFTQQHLFKFAQSAHSLLKICNASRMVELNIAEKKLKLKVKLKNKNEIITKTKKYDFP